MKRKIVLFTVLAGFLSVSLSSYHDGMIGATNRGVYSLTPILTGVSIQGVTTVTTSNCNGDNIGATGCHGTADASLSVNALLYSNATLTHLVTTNGFIPGNNYFIQVTGLYSSTLTLRNFGFQCVIFGWKGTSSVPLPAGTVDITTASTGGGSIRDTIISGAHLVENTRMVNRHLPPLYNPKSYEVNFQWTAPSDTTQYDSVEIRVLMCAVDSSGTATGDAQNAPSSGVLRLHRSIVAVPQIFNNASFQVYPNPAINDVNLQMNNLGKGEYDMYAFDMNGKRIMNRTININGNTHTETINIAAWPSGVYFVQLVRDGQFKNISIVKQ